MAITCLFGVVSAVLRQKFKEGEAAKYRWLVDAINSLKIGKTEVETSDIDIRPESSEADLRDPLKAACDTASAIERENDRLKAHFDQAQRQLQPWSKRLGTLKKMRRENTPCLLKVYLTYYKCLEMLLKEPVSAVPPSLSNVDCVEKDLKPKRQH